MAVTPGQVNLLCPQGSTFSKQITYKIDDQAIDLTGYSARMQVRQNYYSPEALASLSSPNNGITIEELNGVINLFISSEETSSLPAGNFLYDLEIESEGGIVSRIIEGSFIVTPEVTR